MKKIFLLTIGLLLSFSAYSQMSKVQTAWSNLDFYRQDPTNVEPLIKAKDAIDLACEHEKSMVSPKTWMYKGQIYAALAATENPELTKGAADASYEAYMKVIDLEKNEKKARNSKDAVTQLQFLAGNFFNNGVDNFSNKKYKDAYGNFSRYLEISDLQKQFNKKGGVIDTSGIANCALSAFNAEMYPEAKPYYEQLKELQYGESFVYKHLAFMYKKEGNDEAAAQILREAMELFPDDADLVISEINDALNAGDMDMAAKKAEEALKLMPDNSGLYSIIGSAYLQAVEGIKGDDKAKADELNTKAMSMLTKAYELDPKNVDAVYNLGVLENNLGKDIIDQANDLPANDPNYDKLNADGMEHVNVALGYFEKYLDLKPSDENTINFLKSIFARMNMMDKVKEMQDKLDALK